MADIQSVLRKVVPTANATFVAESKNAGAIMQAQGIKSVNAQAHLIAHMAAECAFKTFAENLNYSAARLVQVWPSRFPTAAAAKPYAGNPKALANKVYNGRMGNRVGSDDGWNYRGSGALQHTGRSEFERVDRRTGLGVVASPDKLRDPKNAAVMWAAAATYFVDRKVLPAAERDDILATTKLINGGTNGLADRKVYLARAKAALAGQPIDAKAKTTVEVAEDDKKTATRATVAAPATGAASGGGSKYGGLDTLTAAMLGLSIAVLVGVAAVVLWRRYSAYQAVVETQALQAIRGRVESPEESPVLGGAS